MDPWQDILVTVKTAMTKMSATKVTRATKTQAVLILMGLTNAHVTKDTKVTDTYVQEKFIL